MLFNSFEFILLFLPLTLLGYFLIGRFTSSALYSLLFLGAASLGFYAYWDPRFLPIITSSILINYSFGILLGKPEVSPLWRKILFTAAITCNLVALGFYKYINFGINIWSKLSGHSLESLEVILPLGISFFTFTQIAYLADVYSGHPRERNFVKYLLFVTYFPHLIAGPILHHKEMMPQFNLKMNRNFSAANLALGLTIFAIGLFKKVIIADGFSHIANPVFDAVNHNILVLRDVWGGALAYALQIYFDFSGYSDMAIGLSTMFGIKLPFNFDAPYKSRSIIEFWRRWHITLSRFLRDYVYIPFGGNKQGKLKRYRNLLITMVLGGLWHGAGWTYIVWGYLHGCYLVVNHAWQKLIKNYSVLTAISRTMPYAIFSLLLTQLAVVIAWVYFRADSLKNAHHFLGMMFHLGKFKAATEYAQSTVTNVHLAIIGLAYLCCFMLPNIRGIFDKYDPALNTYENNQTWSAITLKWRASAVWAALTATLLLISILAILIIGDGTEFLYFQF